MKPAAPESTAPIRKPIAGGPAQLGNEPDDQEQNPADHGDGLVLPGEVGRKPSWTALAISCMRALPAGKLRIWLLEIQP